MLIAIDLNFALKGCFLCPAPSLLDNSAKFYFNTQGRMRIHPWVMKFLH